MSDILLATKLTIPPIRKGLVVRPRLMEQLNTGLEHRLTLVSAPAGFGKTTLLSAWAAQCTLPTAWLTVDEDDNDPACFQRYLMAAAKQVGIQSRSEKADETAIRPGMEVWLADFINQAAGNRQDFLLVLDDMHLLTSQPVHAALAFLLEHLPDNLHLVLASRADPPLPLARLRARGQLAEIRLADLRFTAEEASTFLNQAMRLGLTAEDISALVMRTEGWIAGLQMAAISLQSHPDATSFIQAFTGSNRYILDYLMEEVLQRQTPEVQDFLLKTSILEQMCGSLCEAILPGLESGQGQITLERLEHANLFVLPLDDQRDWYRYHRLFADLLQRQLQQALTSEVQNLHRSASQWFEGQGLVGEAIEHSLKAHDFERAAGLIEATANTMLMTSQTATLRRWVQALPAESLPARPHLHIYYACTLLLEGQVLDETERQLQTIIAAGNLLPAHLAPLKAYLALYLGLMPEAVRLSRQALEELPAEDRFLRSVAEWIINIASIYSGDRNAALPVLEQVIQMSQRAGNVMLAVMSVTNLADTYLSKGDLNLAKQSYQRALEMAVDLRGKPLPVSGLPLARLGEIAREHNNLDEAETLLNEGIRRMKPWNNIAANYGLVSLALIQQARGNTQIATEIIQKAIERASQTEATQLDDLLVRLIQSRLWLMQGDLTRVRDWLAQPESDVKFGDLEPHMRMHAHIQRARALITLGRAQEALPFLEALPPALEKAGRKRRIMEVLNLTALAYAALGEQTRALDALEQSLAIAEAGGFVRTVLDEGAAMLHLLEQSAKRGNVYAHRLLEADRVIKTPGVNSVGRSFGKEVLSQRELDVLKLVAAGLSNQEIAERLFVTLRTVKFHTSNILAKLGVKNRIQAVARARELGLFDL